MRVIQSVTDKYKNENIFFLDWTDSHLQDNYDLWVI